MHPMMPVGLRGDLVAIEPLEVEHPHPPACSPPQLPMRSYPWLLYSRHG